MRLQVGHASARGPRPENQDALLALETLGLFAVADGLGGHAGGALASRRAVGALQHAYQHVDLGEDGEAASLERAFAFAQGRLAACAKGAYRDMGTTLVVLRCLGDGAYVAHLGDSRAYRLRAGRLERLTTDHTLVQHWRVAVGDDVPPPSSLAHAVTRALSRGLEPLPDVRELALAPGDVLLLTSDGTHGPLDDRTLAPCLGHPPQVAAEMCVESALRAGGEDNATALVVAVDQG